MSLKEIWTVLDIIKWGTGYLAEKGFDEARLNVELLLSSTLGMKRFDLYVKHDQPLKKEELERFKLLLKRRLAHEPIQYIIGKTNFYSMDIKVDRRALIPRPETETLVETVIEHCRTQLSQKERLEILDIGTGSGCIDVAIARFVKNSRVTSVDNSIDAISLARENATLTGTKGQIDFVESNILSIESNVFGKNFDIIVSNPPYVSELAFASLAADIRDYEPNEAVRDRGDGLTFFRKISRMAKMLLNQGGWVFVETSFDQAREVEKLFNDSGSGETRVKKDFSNIDRVVGAKF